MPIAGPRFETGTSNNIRCGEAYARNARTLLCLPVFSMQRSLAMCLHKSWAEPQSRNLFGLPSRPDPTPNPTTRPHMQGGNRKGLNMHRTAYQVQTEIALMRSPIFCNVWTQVFKMEWRLGCPCTRLHRRGSPTKSVTSVDAVGDFSA